MLTIKNKGQKVMPVYVMRKLVMLKPGQEIQAETMTRREVEHAKKGGAILEGSVKVMAFKNFRDLVEQGVEEFGVGPDMSGAESKEDELKGSGDSPPDDESKEDIDVVEGTEDIDAPDAGDKTDVIDEGESKDKVDESPTGSADEGKEDTSDKTKVIGLFGITEEMMAMEDKDLTNKLDKNFKAVEIRDLLTEAGIENTGIKAELIARIVLMVRA